MSEKKEKVFSLESLKKEGIEVKLTQNDIIDILVSNTIEEIINRSNSIINLITDLKLLKDSEITKAIEKEFKGIKIPKGVTKINISHSLKPDITEGSISHIFLDKNNHDLKNCFYTKVNTIYKSYFINANINLSKKIEGLDFKSSIPFEFQFSYSEEVFKLASKIRQETKNFLETIPENRCINEKEISKSLKVKFNKELLKNISPDTKKMLVSSIGLTI